MATYNIDLSGKQNVFVIQLPGFQRPNAERG